VHLFVLSPSSFEECESRMEARRRAWSYLAASPLFPLAEKGEHSGLGRKCQMARISVALIDRVAILRIHCS
jgi:hypothetical protein